jgi:hypothetical protein
MAINGLGANQKVGFMLKDTDGIPIPTAALF